jgi:hypothetical protein
VEKMSDKLLILEDKLDDLRLAYLNLEVMAGSNNCDSGNVASVLTVLNWQFEQIIDELGRVRKNEGGGVKLISVNGLSTNK